MLGRGVALVVLWSLAIGATAIGLAAAARGGQGGWFLLAFGVLVFVPFAAAFTFIFRKTDDQQIRLDLETGLIRFERVFLLASFLPRTATFECQVEELRRVELVRCRDAPDWLYIHTPRGRVVLHSASDNFHGLKEVLIAVVPKGRVPITSRYWFPGALAGVLVFGALAIALWMGWLP